MQADKKTNFLPTANAFTAIFSNGVGSSLT